MVVQILKRGLILNKLRVSRVIQFGCLDLETWVDFE